MLIDLNVIRGCFFWPTLYNPSQDTDSQDSEISILAIDSEPDTQDSTALTPYQKDVSDYVESDNSVESIDTVLDNSEKRDEKMDTDSEVSFDTISEQDSDSSLPLVPISSYG